MLPVDFLYMAFIMVRHIPSIISLLRGFNHERCFCGRMRAGPSYRTVLLTQRLCFFLEGHQSCWMKASPLWPHLTLVTSLDALSPTTGLVRKSVCLLCKRKDIFHFQQ